MKLSLSRNEQLQSLRTQLLRIGEVKTFITYWELYGGFKALFKSVYFYCAIFFTLVGHPFWMVDEAHGRAWAQTAIDIVPSMLGFSMGGMAIMLAFSSNEIFKALSQKGKANSYFMGVVAAFFHFIFVQTLAIFAAIFSKYFSNSLLSCLGFFLMSYALLVALATAGVLLHTARIFNASAKERPHPPFYPPSPKP